ncbi:MAG: hypothetical protein LBS64_04415 [Spirochaetaceae bacterium]|jgi:thiamine pyrophosphokinase|nr:hypothetical protein [Spirochaetaceae bacterium]
MSIWVFTGGLYPAPEQTEHLWTAYGAPQYVIAADSGLHAAEAYQTHAKNRSPTEDPDARFTPDWICGDFDSVADDGFRSRYSPELIETYRCDKDLTDTEAALQKARQMRRGDEPVILAGGDGGRTDHLAGILNLFGTDIGPDLWLGAIQGGYCIGGRHPAALKIAGLTGDDTVSVYHAPRNPWRNQICGTGTADTGGLGSDGLPKIHGQGLFWDISDLPWQNGAYSLSNKIASPGAEVGLAAKNGVFLVFLPLRNHIIVTFQRCQAP